LASWEKEEGRKEEKKEKNFNLKILLKARRKGFMLFNKTILILLVTSGPFFLGAFAHEKDIQRQCLKTGRAGEAAWLGELNCSPKERLPGESKGGEDGDCGS